MVLITEYIHTVQQITAKSSFAIMWAFSVDIFIVGAYMCWYQIIKSALMACLKCAFFHFLVVAKVPFCSFFEYYFNTYFRV